MLRDKTRRVYSRQITTRQNFRSTRWEPLIAKRQRQNLSRTLFAVYFERAVRPGLQKAPNWHSRRDGILSALLTMLPTSKSHSSYKWLVWKQQFFNNKSTRDPESIHKWKIIGRLAMAQNFRSFERWEKPHVLCNGSFWNRDVQPVHISYTILLLIFLYNASRKVERLLQSHQSRGNAGRKTLWESHLFRDC